MMGRQCRGVNGVKSAQQIQLAVVLRSRVAQNCHLNGHRIAGECSPCPELFSNNFGFKLARQASNFAFHFATPKTFGAGALIFSRAIWPEKNRENVRILQSHNILQARHLRNL
jgi:hypothetical protein